MDFGHNIRRVSILAFLLALQFIVPVDAAPAFTDVKGTTGQTAAAQFLDLRQDIPGPLAKFPRRPLNALLRMFSSLPAGERALDATRKLLTPLQQGLARAVGIETTRDDMAQNAPCSDVTVIFARGTTEPGNVGLVTGPPFLDALSEQLAGRSLSVQGVEYPATFAGFNKNGTEGVPSMTAFINQAVTSCPNTKIIMSGYSQGALVVRSTADSLPADTMSKINSVVTFGDPRNQTPITGGEGKTMVVCLPDDAVCSGGFINIAHLTYGSEAPAAAQFVV
ncbi:cutinase, partial [Microdochium bolleyi]